MGKTIAIVLECTNRGLTQRELQLSVKPLADDILTPKRVAIISKIPVIHAMVLLTSTISETRVELVGVFVSSSQRGDAREAISTFSSFFDSEAGASPWMITPTI